MQYTPHRLRMASPFYAQALLRYCTVYGDVMWQEQAEMRSQGRLAYVILLIPVFFLVMVVIHEIGHAYVITKTGAASAKILVWPGYEIYPNFGAKVEMVWPGKSFAITRVVPISRGAAYIGSTLSPAIAPSVDYERIRENENIIVLMGVVATTAVSIFSLTCISLFRPKGIFLWVLGAFSLMHIDALTYAIFPVFFDAPHFLFWGGTISEPITSLVNFGLSRTFAVSLILALSVVQFIWLYFLIAPNRVGFVPKNKSKYYAPSAPDAASRAGF